MNEAIMKTLTCPLLAVTEEEEKGDAPVTKRTRLLARTRPRGVDYALNYVKKKASPSPVSSFFFSRLSHHLPASSGAGWHYTRARGNAIISIS